MHVVKFQNVPELLLLLVHPSTQGHVFQHVIREHAICYLSLSRGYVLLESVSHKRDDEFAEDLLGGEHAGRKDNDRTSIIR